MSYLIKWTPQASRYVENLPRDIAERIVNKIERIEEDPFHYLEHYTGEDVYKLRIGDYRALIDGY